MSTTTNTHSSRRIRRTTLAAVAALALTAAVGTSSCSDDSAAGPDRGSDTTDHHDGSTTPSSTTAPTTDAPTTTPTTVATETGPFEVTATEFRFDGLPEQVAAGAHTFTFTNDGAETHELFIFRNTEQLSVEELEALGPARIGEHVEIAGLTVAAPGAAAAEPLQAQLTPGEWEAICFIPTPTDGQPHALHGMHTTITVV